MLSLRGFAVFGTFVSIVGLHHTPLWASEGLNRIDGSVDAILQPTQVLESGEPMPMNSAEMDQVAQWLRNGSATRALELLEARLDAATTKHCRQRILTAVARMGHSRFDGVEKLLEPCRSRKPIQPHLDMLAAKAACGHGNIPLMQRRLKSVRSGLAYQDSETLAHARALEVRCLIEHRNPKVALKKVEAFLDTYPEAPMYTEFEFARIELLERLRKVESAWSLATEFMIRYSKHPLRAAAEELLARLGDRKSRSKKVRKRSWKNRIDTVRHLVRHKQWEDVDAEIDILEKGLFESAVPDEWVEAVESVVLVYLKHRSSFERAEGLVLRENANRTAETWERVVSYRSAQGDLRGAEAALKKIPMHRNVRQERQFALYLSFGRFSEAKDFARKILVRKRRPAQTFLFKAALAEWLGGDLERARALLERCMKKKRDKRSRFFHAMVLRDLGETQRALSSWQELASDDPEGYYGVMARSRLSELGGDSRETALASLLPLHSNFLTTAFDEVDSMVLGEVSPEVLDLSEPIPTDLLFAESASWFSGISPRLSRAYDAYRFGMAGVVQAELRTFAMELFRARRARGNLRRYAQHTVGSTLDNRRPTRGVWGRKNKVKRKRMTRSERKGEIEKIRFMFSAWRDPRFELVIRLLDTFDEPMLPRMYALYKGGGRPEAEQSFQKWAYPMPWLHDTEVAGREAGVPVVLLHAVMNIESAFYSRAVSRAGARGLFQIMPQTAMRLAYDLGESPPNLDEMLTRDVSLRYGSQYLARLIDEFRGQIPLVLAGYNAGPHHVKKWLKQRGDIPLDVFVELIPFAQARGYVKKGIARLTSTLRVHSGRRGLYLTRSLDPTTAGQLDY